MKNKIIKLFVLLCFIPLVSVAITSNYTTFTDGSVLNASDLNNLQTHYTDADNAILNGDTFTGNMNWHSGSDALFYSDTGSTLTSAIYGDTGKIIGAVAKTGANNLEIVRATTTNAGDSIKIQCGSSACSATNPGFVVIGDSTTPGVTQRFIITSDVTILLTGAHWGAGTTGDLTGEILRVLLINDLGTLRTCVSLLGGRDMVLRTDTNATQTNVNLPEEILCNTAVASFNNSVIELGYFRANFDDTGGAAEDLWAVQSGVNDVVTGKSSDGLWRPHNATHGGYSASPTATVSRWTQVGRTIHYQWVVNAAGTSDSTGATITGPAKAAYGIYGNSPRNQDNSGTATSDGIIKTTAGSATLSLYPTGAEGNWTGSNSKYSNVDFSYEVGPVASFLE